MTIVDLNRLHTFARFSELLTGGQWMPTWCADMRRFCVVDGAPDHRVILTVDPQTGETTPLLDVASVRKALEAVLGAPLPWNGLPFQAFRLTDGDQRVEFTYEDRWFSVDVATSQVTEFAVAEQDRRRLTTPRLIGKTFLGPRLPIHELPAPDGTRLLTKVGGNLALRHVSDDRVALLTNDATDDITWTVENARWSSDGRFIAAIRTDATGVDRFPIVHWLKQTEEVEWVPYSKSGARQSIRSLCVIDTISADVTVVDLGRAGDDLFMVMPLAFQGRNDLLFLVTDRRNIDLELRRADVQTGSSDVVVSERQQTFVYGINFLPLATSATILPDGEHLIWMSERDGWRHAYLYRLDGTLVRRLTKGSFEVARVVGFDITGSRIYFLARSDTNRPYDQHLCVVGLDGSGFRQITTDPGTHVPIIAPLGGTIIDIHSSIDRPPRTDLLADDGTLIRTLSTADTSLIDELGYFPPQEFVVKALDGTTNIFGAIYHPPAFDPAKRYPIVEYIYAGPQMSLFPTDFAGPSLARMLAQVGFVTVVFDAPGTPHRGKVFQDAVYGKFGQFEIEEHANVIHQLVQRHPYMDPHRVGVVGGSWGGYNTVRALLRAPDTYHVGVAIYPVADCRNHIGTAIEPYLNLPQDNHDAYRSASSLDSVDRLRGKLYLIHGTSDVNSPVSATMQLIDAFIKADKPVDLLLIPEMDHSMEGFRGTYIFDRLAEYFAEHLGGVEPQT